MGRPAAPTDSKGFSPRERQLLVYLSKGFRITEAAGLMHIGECTARDYAKTALKKLGAGTQAEAVYRAVKEGVIE